MSVSDCSRMKSHVSIVSPTVAARLREKTSIDSYTLPVAAYCVRLIARSTSPALDRVSVPHIWLQCCIDSDSQVYLLNIIFAYNCARRTGHTDWPSRNAVYLSVCRSSGPRSELREDCMKSRLQLIAAYAADMFFVPAGMSI